MKFIYRHPVTTETVEIQDLAPKEEFNRLRDEGFEQIKAIPETVEDEDILYGHPYPGHETWDD